MAGLGVEEFLILDTKGMDPSIFRFLMEDYGSFGDFSKDFQSVRIR